MMIAAVGLIIGVISAVSVYMFDDMIGLIVGAVGLVLGGYSVNLSNHCKTSEKMAFLIMSGIGLALSMIGFMLGLAGVVG